MLRVMIFVILLGLSFWGVADTVRARQDAAGEEKSGMPALNIEAGCRDVSKN